MVLLVAVVLVMAAMVAASAVTALAQETNEGGPWSGCVIEDSDYGLSITC